MTLTSQPLPTKKPPHFATLLVMALAPGEIGARISERRGELGWTHRKLADEMNVGERTVQRWQKGVDPKTGKSWLPRLGTLMELAEVMGVDRSYFVEAPERGNREEQQAALMQGVAEGIVELERSSEDVLQHLDDVLSRLERIEDLLSPPEAAQPSS